MGGGNQGVQLPVVAKRLVANNFNTGKYAPVNFILPSSIRSGPNDAADQRALGVT